MDGFWDQSWANADMDRINGYIGRMEMSSDPIIKYLKEQRAQAVCDAGCGCGIYSLKLALHGFAVSGFDISSTAVEMTKKLLKANGRA